MNTQRFFDNQFVPLGVILGAAFVIVGVVAAGTAISIRNASNTLTVTGSATADVAADSAKWTISANRSSLQEGIPSATIQVLGDTKQIVAFFVKAGIVEKNITIGAVHTDIDYSSYRGDPNAPNRYMTRQDVTVATDDPKLIQRLSQDTSALSNLGIVFTSQDPQYFISNLAQYRISLAGEAMKDAKARAAELVKDSGQSVGKLRSASTAAVQVLSAHSLDISDYGTYDTQTIDKTVMVSVRATFAVN